MCTKWFLRCLGSPLLHLKRLVQWCQTFLIHGPISDFSVLTQGKLIYNFTFNNFYSCITISTIVNYFSLVQSGLV